MSSVVLMVAVVASSVIVMVRDGRDAIAHGKALVGRGCNGGGTPNGNGVAVFVVGAAIVTDFELQVVSGFGGGKGGKAEAAYGDVIARIEVRRHSND